MYEINLKGWQGPDYTGSVGPIRTSRFYFTNRKLLQVLYFKKIVLTAENRGRWM